MPAASPVIRVATYNVHGCVGTDGRHDPHRIADVIAELDADIVALQEFTYPTDVALETRTPVVLTTLDQYQCALGPTRRNDRHCFGNVLLTRHPILDVRRIDLSMARREPRGALAATIKVGGEPEGVDLRPDGKVVYVTSEQDNQIAVIDAVAPRLITTFQAGPRPRSTGFLPDSSRAYISAENGSAVVVADAVAHRVIHTIPLAGEMVRPMGIAPSPDGQYVFVSTGRGKSVVIIDARSNDVVGAIEVGERPWGITISPDGKTVFTANGPSNDVSFVDVASRTVIARVKVGDRPWGVAYLP